jgi:hypothetical protein
MILLSSSSDVTQALYAKGVMALCRVGEGNFVKQGGTADL